ncbi:MAG: calcium/sodium antiporter [Bacteroidales bacterium]|nr:calcium/sodium antiporter [Bacteroidales bacterium]
MEYLLLLIGFAVLLFSGNLLVKGSVGIAERYHVSRLVIGVVIVSFGTSAPELFVSGIAAYKGEFDVSMGNVVGSNIANIGLVLAITAIIVPIPVKRLTVINDAPFMIFASALLLFVVSDGQIHFYEGLGMIAALALYITFILKRNKKKGESIEEAPKENHPKGLSMLLLMLTGATVGLAIGSQLLIDNAKIIAEGWGVSEQVISITILAFGTSLPELATSAIAAIKKEMDISVGNIVGSNIFNILSVLGISSLISGIKVSEKFISFDIPCLLVLAALLYIFLLPANKSKILRWKGAVLLISYLTYIAYLYINTNPSA